MKVVEGYSRQVSIIGVEVASTTTTEFSFPHVLSCFSEVESRSTFSMVRGGTVSVVDKHGTSSGGVLSQGGSAGAGSGQGMEFTADEQGTLLSPVGQPYDPTELQRSFTGMSARDVYTLLCKRCGCRAVGSVLSLLPEKPGEWFTVDELDLSRTYIGPRGAVPLMEVCKLLPALKYLNLNQNYLSNRSIYHVCKVALYHPTLSRLELGGNDISWTAGMSILELVTRNPRVTRVGLSDTLIYPNVQETILNQVRRNIVAESRGQRRGANPSNHPMTIRLRSLKRFFRDALAKEGITAPDGRLPKTILLDGLKELMRLTGREVELEQKNSPAFYERFMRRVSSDSIDWETLMLVLLCEDVTVNSEAVEDLRAVFHHYDVDNVGYVGYSDLADMMTLLRRGSPPTKEEVQAKMAEFNADDTMTLNWDEFLLLLYDKGPAVGQLSTFHVHTPMRQHRSLHY
jgi:Ca2+-binding EF-hand superfamily protein